MRGRTNVIGNVRNFNGNLSINGNIETYNIADNNIINEGDFVSIYKDSSPIINNIQMRETSDDDGAFLSYMGECDGNKFYYMISSSTYTSMILLICYSPDGEILFSTNMPPSGFKDYGINEMVVVGKYIVFVKVNYNNNRYNNAILLYKIDINGKKIEKVYEKNYSDTSVNTPKISFVCSIDNERFVTASYDESALPSKYNLYLYKIKNTDDTESIELLDSIEISDSITPIFKAIGNKIVCITYDNNFNYCKILEINENNNLNIILDNNIERNFSDSSTKRITCVLLIGEDLFVLQKDRILGSDYNASGTIYVIDTLNGMIKSTYTKKYLNSITYYDNTLYAIVNGETREGYINIILMKYANGVFQTIKESYLCDGTQIYLTNDDIEYRLSRNAYLCFYETKPKLILYYIYSYNKNVYKRFFVEMDIKKVGSEFVFGGNYVKQYDGSSAIGVARTSGNGGDSIEVYVPFTN